MSTGLLLSPPSPTCLEFPPFPQARSWRRVVAAWPAWGPMVRAGQGRVSQPGLPRLAFPFLSMPLIIVRSRQRPQDQ